MDSIKRKGENTKIVWNSSRRKFSLNIQNICTNHYSNVYREYWDDYVSALDITYMYKLLFCLFVFNVWITERYKDITYTSWTLDLIFSFAIRNSKRGFKRCESVNLYSYQPQFITETRRKIEDLCRLVAICLILH